MLRHDPDRVGGLGHLDQHHPHIGHVGVHAVGVAAGVRRCRHHDLGHHAGDTSVAGTGCPGSCRRMPRCCCRRPCPARWRTRPGSACRRGADGVVPDRDRGGRTRVEVAFPRGQTMVTAPARRRWPAGPGRSRRTAYTMPARVLARARSWRRAPARRYRTGRPRGGRPACAAPARGCASAGRRSRRRRGTPRPRPRRPAGPPAPVASPVLAESGVVPNP